MTTERILTLIRHAKSSWEDAKLRDFDRPLNERGQQDAPEMARRMAARGERPDHFLASSARRARETALILAQGVGFPEGDIHFERDLYLADSQQLLSTIQRLPDTSQNAWLVGHNPDLTELANLLAGPQTDNLPTCAVFQMAFEAGSWRDVKPETGQLRVYDTPKAPWQAT
ncbi:SixA phosphatase family protein [Halomonadaceae bacterium KBTZ08]